MLGKGLETSLIQMILCLRDAGYTGRVILLVKDQCEYGEEIEVSLLHFNLPKIQFGL